MNKHIGSTLGSLFEELGEKGTLMRSRKQSRHPKRYEPLLRRLITYYIDQFGLPHAFEPKPRGGLSADVDLAMKMVETLIDRVVVLEKELAETKTAAETQIGSLKAQVDAAEKLKLVREGEAKETREVLRGALEIVVDRLRHATAPNISYDRSLDLCRQALGFAGLVLDAEKERRGGPSYKAKLMSLIRMVALGGLLYPKIAKAVAEEVPKK